MKKSQNTSDTLRPFDDPIEHFYLDNQELYSKLGKKFINPMYYVNKTSNLIVSNDKKITFTHNKDEPIHRWSPYLEGFSTAFVKHIIQEYNIKQGEVVLDPFAGCGTLNVTAKINNLDSIGIEINPAMHFILTTKLNWNIDLKKFEHEIKKLNLDQPLKIRAPDFLDSTRQFKPDVLVTLLKIKQAINEVEDSAYRNLMMIALASILMACSNLKRSPSIGYVSNKNVNSKLTLLKYREKIQQIIQDLNFVRTKSNKSFSKTINSDSRNVKLESDSVNYIITSPPYLNFLDYTQNYKIEMGWLGHMTCKRDYSELKERMVVCDNVSRQFIKEYSRTSRLYAHDWLNQIQDLLEKKMIENPPVRRQDYPHIVRKYFDDLYQIMKNVSKCLVKDGKFIIVIGDSLISGVYVPTDFLLAKIAEEIGFSIKKIVIARSRRSGIVRSFKLRESVIHLNYER